MGSVFSKTSRTARSYPTRSSIQARPTGGAGGAGGKVDPAFPSSIAKSQLQKPELQQQEGQVKEIGQENSSNPTSHDDPLSAADPSLAAHLRKLGPVTPFPTRSNTSTFNSSSSSPPASTTASAAAARAADSVIIGNDAFTPPTSAMNQAIRRTNPALTVLEARERLAQEAEEESDGSVRTNGRRFVNVGMLRDIVELRGRMGDAYGDEKEEADEVGTGGSGRRSLSTGRLEDAEIEKRFGLKNDILAKLGRRGIVESV